MSGPVLAAVKNLLHRLPGGNVLVDIGGTDGFGRSDYRARLRDFFEVNRHWVVVAALHSLAEEGVIPAQTVADALARYGIDTDRPAPWTV